jgi:hypothetical protein
MPQTEYHPFETQLPLDFRCTAMEHYAQLQQ